VLLQQEGGQARLTGVRVEVETRSDWTFRPSRFRWIIPIRPKNRR